MELFSRQMGVGKREVIIVHGLYGASDNWLSIASGLEDKFKIIIPDQRNHGKSPHSKEHNYTLLAEDLYQLIKTKTSGKVILIGHSMGGKSVMRLALKYPEVVEHLVIVDIAPKNYGRTSNFGEEPTNHEGIIKAMQDLELDKMESRKEIEEQWKSQFPSRQLRQFLLKNVKRTSKGKFKWQLNLDALAENLSEIMDGFSDLENFTPFKAAPVLVIRGENSSYFRNEDNMALNKFFPQAQVVTIPNAGHWVHAEQQDLFLKTLLYFLED
ncbi:MAG TPA: alpha/beta fold hydrolase [Marinilabiliaceae bacterium]|nr:alpha/beta fold hydrolase [Marinilabiliaceae bacterium]